MILEITFLTGRFHATPWGRHVNEAVPEWPPSPFRLLRAALDSWYRKHPDIPISVIERLMKAMSRPPNYLLPRARASHTRSYLAQNKEDASDKKLVFDGFAVLDRGARLLVGWPGLTLDPDLRDAADRLFSSLSYLGRSETWISSQLLDDTPTPWNCVPVEAGTVPRDQEIVSVAGVIPPAAFDLRGLEIPSQGKKTLARRLGWLEALGWGSAEVINHTMNLPPAMEPVFYVRPTDALRARPTAAERPPGRLVEVVRFSVGGRVAAPLTDALLIAEHVRRNLMGSLAGIVGRGHLTSRVTGKTADGSPAQGHSHLSVLPLDEDGDGSVDALLVSSPEPFTLQEQQAIDRLHPVRRRNGHPLILTPVQWAAQSDVLTLATTVVSHTPFAPTSHWRLNRDGDLDAWLAGQVAIEAERRGLPRPVAIRRIPPPADARRRYRWLDFRRSRKGDAPQPAFGLEVVFAEPVRAPLSLGYASHFGLGCFIPAGKIEIQAASP